MNMVNGYGQKCNKQTPKINPWHPEEETQGFTVNNKAHTQLITQYAKQLVKEIIFFHA